MSYQPVQNTPDGDEVKDVHLGEDSETETEGCSRDSEDTLFLGFKRKHFGKIPIQGLYRKAREANVPLLVSLHLLVLNLILSVVLVSHLRSASQCGSAKLKDPNFAPGELLWSQSSPPRPYCVRRG